MNDHQDLARRLFGLSPTIRYVALNRVRYNSHLTEAKPSRRLCVGI